MNYQLEKYKAFIDHLVEIRPSALVRWVKENGWPQLPENQKLNQLLEQLTPEQKEVVAQMVQQGRDDGIHDTLVALSGVDLIQENIVFAVEPYGTPLHYDWVCRREGDEWPEHQLVEKYKHDTGTIT
jgi:hypothetical protein